MTINMDTDIISDYDFAEDIYWFMEDKYDGFCEYLSETPQDVSMAEYVEMFYKAEFVAYINERYNCRLSTELQ